jgi:hypothetical protein
MGAFVSWMLALCHQIRGGPQQGRVSGANPWDEISAGPPGASTHDRMPHACALAGFLALYHISSSPHSPNGDTIIAVPCPKLACKPSCLLAWHHATTFPPRPQPLGRHSCSLLYRSLSPSTPPCRPSKPQATLHSPMPPSEPSKIRRPPLDPHMPSPDLP